MRLQYKAPLKKKVRSGTQLQEISVPVTNCKLSTVDQLLRNSCSNCTAINKAETTKNGIFIRMINGCTMIEEVVIISCQYNMINIKDVNANGIERRVKATETCSE